MNRAMRGLACAAACALSMACAKNAGPATYRYAGVDYKVVSGEDDFVASFARKEPAALKIRYEDYSREKLLAIKAACDKYGVGQESLYSPSEALCLSCQYQLSMAESFGALMGGAAFKNCPNCGKSRYFVYLTKAAAQEPVPGIDLRSALKGYFRHLAVLWWPDEGQRSLGICDSCNGEVKAGEGYIYGFLDAGRVKAYRLWCESCMDEKLAKSLDTAFDESDKRNALEYAKSTR